MTCLNYILAQKDKLGSNNSRKDLFLSSLKERIVYVNANRVRTQTQFLPLNSVGFKFSCKFYSKSP